MGAIASQITSLTIVYSIVYSDADQRKHQSSASLAYVRVIHRGPVNFPHKWPVTRKMFPLDDVIMNYGLQLKHFILPDAIWQVSKINSILSIIFHAIYWAMYIQLTHLSYYDFAKTCTLSYHHQTRSMAQLPLFRFKSWNNGISCMSLYSYDPQKAFPLVTNSTACFIFTRICQLFVSENVKITFM